MNLELGAIYLGNGKVRFTVWAPKAKSVEVRLLTLAERIIPMAAREDGFFAIEEEGVLPGSLYRYRLDGGKEYPDPASRFQPQGVHGPSQVVDPSAFAWTDEGWRGINPDRLILYELHIGAFTPSGTFIGAMEQLPYLKDLGITAIEVMPVADFPGLRGWGYDGVSLYAPSRCYGSPDQLREFINVAHREGMGVILDVVYNHLGPGGNYLSSFSGDYFTDAHKTPWGSAVNLDQKNSAHARRFFIENALHWVREYHMDGLRFDATHALYDDSGQHLLSEIRSSLNEEPNEARTILIAEDRRNLSVIVTAQERGGWGLNYVWSDDFHHSMRRLMAGDHEAYFMDFKGTARELAATVKEGWLYSGQYSEFLKEPRGTNPAGLDARSRVFCIQNHDQIGNRALGERLHHQVEPSAFRAASALLLCCPETPLLFMGQEWAASAPFLYFTDHNEELGQKVTEGRREEFRHFSSFSNSAARQLIPDPQSEDTFLKSVLNWEEIGKEPHASLLRLYRTLLTLRHKEPSLSAQAGQTLKIEALDDATLALRRAADNAPSIFILVRLKGAGKVDLSHHSFTSNKDKRWDLLLNTETPQFAPDPDPPMIGLYEPQPYVEFKRPAALIFKES